MYIHVNMGKYQKPGFSAENRVILPEPKKEGFGFSRYIYTYLRVCVCGCYD